jgi:hypothetical protein
MTSRKDFVFTEPLKLQIELPKRTGKSPRTTSIHIVARDYCSSADKQYFNGLTRHFLQGVSRDHLWRRVAIKVMFLQVNEIQLFPDSQTFTIRPGTMGGGAGTGGTGWKGCRLDRGPHVQWSGSAVLYM